jgi:predicted helicase
MAFIGMRQVVQDNVEYTHFGVSQSPVDARCFSSNKGIVQIFPLLAFNKRRDQTVWNIGDELARFLSDTYGQKWSQEASSGLLGPMSVLHYVVAYTQSRRYRRNYSELLRRDYPRVKFPNEWNDFHDLISLGEKIVRLMILDRDSVSDITTAFPEEGTNVVERRFPSYDRANRRVYINKEQYFEGVCEEVWNWQQGGRQVCSEWIKSRRNTMLTYDENMVYQQIVTAIGKIIAVTDKIDERIESGIEFISRPEPKKSVRLHDFDA